VLEKCRVGLRWITVTLVLLMSFGQTSPAQSSADQKKSLTLEEAVDRALKNYPWSECAMGRRNGWVTGLSVNGNVEVFGDLKRSDEVIRNATDAIRFGQQMKTSSSHS
jgi:hypothetical protein